MKKSIIFFILPLIIQGAFAEMDWENMVLRGSHAEQEKAADLLQEELYALQYDEKITVGDFLKLNSDRENRLKELLLKYRSLSRRYLTDGGIEYVYHVPLAGKIIAALLPETKPFKLTVPMLCPCCGQEWPQGKAVPEDIKLIPKQIDSTVYTGIIIECRGLELNPCIFPKVVSEIVEEVYSIDFADPQHVIDGGLVFYTTKDVHDNQRVGENPLRIQALCTVGEWLTDIKISTFDAQRIHGSMNNINLLKECRVAVIFGR